MAVTPRISVARRLALLAIVEIATVAILSLVALGAMRHVERNLAVTRHYGVPPINVLGKALIDNNHVRDVVVHQLDSGVAPDRALLERHIQYLRDVEGRYRAEWLIKDNPSPQAQAAREVLASVDHLALIEEEGAAMSRLSDALDHLEVIVNEDPSPDLVQTLTNIQNAIRLLNSASTTNLIHWEAALESEVTVVRRRVAVVAVVGLAIAAWAALRVRKAIAPRIRRLVRKVQTFKELGVNETVADRGRDEIGILANAIDAGFGAIVERDRERERFLAIVAHELKTPVSSILGFAHAANTRPNNVDVARKALETVERQGQRLSRLLEDVLLAARARLGDLPCHREPTDLVRDVRKVLDEIAASGESRHVLVEAPHRAPILADKDLLSHALWTLLTYAISASTTSEPVGVHVKSEPPRSEIEVDLQGRHIQREDLERALAPFGSLMYESPSSARTGVGLYLVREIARIHGGALRMEDTNSGYRFLLELPS
jgi:signal transduction histidine kinase